MFTVVDADFDDDDQEIGDPMEVAQLFADIAAVAIDTIGPDEARVLFEAVIAQAGRELN